MSYGPVPGTLYVPNTYQEAMVFHPLLAQRVLGGMNGSTLYNRVVGPSCSWYTAETVPIPTAQARYIRTGMANTSLVGGLSKRGGTLSTSLAGVEIPSQGDKPFFDVVEFGPSDEPYVDDPNFEPYDDPYAESRERALAFVARAQQVLEPLALPMMMIMQGLQGGETVSSAVAATLAQLPSTPDIVASVRRAGVFLQAVSDYVAGSGYSVMQAATLIDDLLNGQSMSAEAEELAEGALELGLLAVEQDIAISGEIQPDWSALDETNGVSEPVAPADSTGESKRGSIVPWLIGGVLALRVLR